jgi:hypothetical protein
MLKGYKILGKKEKKDRVCRKHTLSFAFLFYRKALLSYKIGDAKGILPLPTKEGAQNGGYWRDWEKMILQ